MPHRKRIRTTHTDPLAPRSVRKLQQLRRIVALEAARIMATEGQHNYKAAKTKAAERIGVKYRQALPSNIEVAEALRAHQVFYGGEKHFENLRFLRENAIRAMRALEKFCPRLVGPVLDGTADAHSRVSLHLFHDPPDEVLLHLQNQGLEFTQEQRRIRWHDGTYRLLQLLVTQTNGAVVELALFNNVDLRQAPPSPVDGKPQKRAPLTEVEGLVAAA